MADRISRSPCGSNGLVVRGSVEAGRNTEMERGRVKGVQGRPGFSEVRMQAPTPYPCNATFRSINSPSQASSPWTGLHLSSLNWGTVLVIPRKKSLGRMYCCTVAARTTVRSG